MNVTRAVLERGFYTRMQLITPRVYEPTAPLYRSRQRYAQRLRVGRTSQDPQDRLDDDCPGFRRHASVVQLSDDLRPFGTHRVRQVRHTGLGAPGTYRMHRSLAKHAIVLVVSLSQRHGTFSGLRKDCSRTGLQRRSLLDPYRHLKGRH